MKLILSLIVFPVALSQAATINWSQEGGGSGSSGFRQGRAVQLNGANSTFFPAAGFQEIGSAQNITDSEGNTVVYTASYTGGIGSGDNPALDNTVDNSVGIGFGAAGFTTNVIADSSGSDGGWGGIIATNATDRSGLVVNSLGGPISQFDDTINQLGISFDFSMQPGGGVTNLQFDIAGINAKLSGGTLENQDRFIFRAYGPGNTPISWAEGFLNGPGLNGDTTTGFYTLTGLAGTDLTALGDLTQVSTPGNDDHNADARLNLGFDFGTQEIERLELLYAPEVEGNANGSSSGFAISDFEFNPIPEPSSILLLALAGLGLTMTRKR